MRLIDADELRKEINKQAYPHSDSTANDIYFSVLHLLTDTPTVDAVRHGKWKMRTDEDGFWYYCSECKQNALFDIFNYQEKSDYCPQCGAKMEGCNDA